MAWASISRHVMDGDPLVIDQPHLLEDRRLPRFSRTKEEHLDLIAQICSIPLQLILDFLVPWTAISEMLDI